MRSQPPLLKWQCQNRQAHTPGRSVVEDAALTRRRFKVQAKCLVFSHVIYEDWIVDDRTCMSTRHQRRVSGRTVQHGQSAWLVQASDEGTARTPIQVPISIGCRPTVTPLYQLLEVDDHRPLRHGAGH